MRGEYDIYESYKYRERAKVASSSKALKGKQISPLRGSSIERKLQFQLAISD